MATDKEQKKTTEQEKTMKGFRADFDQKMASVVLPARFAKDYRVVNCIKDTEDRSVYVVEDREGNKFILKRGSDKRAEALWQEFHLKEQLKKAVQLAVPASVSCIETDDGCYLMNEYIKGLNLVQYQEKYAPLSEPDVVSLMFKMCHIVNILHSQEPPVIHRDIKPENFILEEGTGVLYLVDLDTGRQYLPQKKRDTMFVGTFSQAAPEQFGFSQSDIRTDIYGLGKSMVYLLTGDAAAENLQEYGVSQEFCRIVQKSTEFDPDKRYTDVRQMIRALKRYQLRHVKLPSYRLAAVCSMLFLAAGLALGYHAGGTAQRRNAAEDQQVALPGDAARENDTDNAKDTSPASLRDQAGVFTFDPLSYREYCDQIILDYYASDEDALAKDCEALVTAVSQDPEISRIPGVDYDKNDVGYEADFWNMDVINTVRARLAYKNKLLERKLGDYDKYKHFFLNNFGLNLSEPNGNTFLACYARGESRDGADEYTMNSWILSDSLACIVDAMDQYAAHNGEE